MNMLDCYPIGLLLDCPCLEGRITHTYAVRNAESKMASSVRCIMVPDLRLRIHTYDPCLPALEMNRFPPCMMTGSIFVQNGDLRCREGRLGCLSSRAKSYLCFLTILQVKTWALVRSQSYQRDAATSRASYMQPRFVIRNGSRLSISVRGIVNKRKSCAYEMNPSRSRTTLYR